MPAPSPIIDFHKDDFPKTLFPLKTNLWLIENGWDVISSYIYSEITGNETETSGDFQQQEVAYAAKHGHHLRRTHKLDPVAEFFLYDIIYRNRAKFRAEIFPNRKKYGYRFKGGSPIPPSESYKEFRSNIGFDHIFHQYSCSFDISSYFNSLYHHDLATWFERLVGTGEDSMIFGKFFRQINGGRSVDCLPHGIYPTKVIGNHFLDYIDNFPGIESISLHRFMDDFTLFANDPFVLQRDFILIQQLLGQKGLSVNPAKTKFRDKEEPSVREQVNVIRDGLVARRGNAFKSLYFDDEPDKVLLTDAETAYLVGLLDSPDLEEEDADLVLAYLRDEALNLTNHISTILWRFPYLSKSVYLFCRFIEDKGALLNALNQFIKDNKVMSEYSLFWVACILEDYLLGAPGVEALVSALYEHPRATKISKAKLLEIPDSRYGLRELRERNLRTGGTDWLNWSSAVGARAEPKGYRNHVIKYFAKSSRLNAVIAEIVGKS